MPHFPTPFKPNFRYPCMLPPVPYPTRTLLCPLLLAHPCWMMGVILACLSPHARYADVRVSPASHSTPTRHHTLADLIPSIPPTVPYSPSFSTMPSSLHIIALLHLWRRSLSLLPHPCHPLGFGLSHPPPPLCHHRISLKAHRTMVSINPKP